MATDTLPPLLLCGTAVVFVAAGLVKGVVGLGLPTVAMALLALLLPLPPAQAAAFLIVPSLATNLWQAGSWRTLAPLWRRLAPLQAGVCLGTWGGLAAWGAPGGQVATGALGAVLIAYGAWGLAGRSRTLHAGERAERWFSAPMGMLTGGLTAATGVFVVPAVPWLQMLGLARDDLVRAMGLSFSVSTVALAIGLGTRGDAGWAEAGLSLLMLPPALAGMELGRRLRTRLSPAAFRTGFFAALMVLGVHLCWHAAWAR